MSKNLLQERNANGAEQQRSCWLITHTLLRTKTGRMVICTFLVVWFCVVGVISVYIKDWYSAARVVSIIILSVLIAVDLALWNYTPKS